jgi:N-acetylglucosaminyldiphosphoundecaprenol N-acetyl-beta-D-mannosaminyltransferase
LIPPLGHLRSVKCEVRRAPYSFGMARLVDLQVPTVEVGRMLIARLDRASTADLIITEALRRRSKSKRLLPAYFTSANGHVLSLVATSGLVSWLFAEADLISADGQPMVLASRWLTRTPLPERVATTDLFHDVAVRAMGHDLGFYFLGATAEENAKAVSQVRARYPALRIVGARDGYFSRADEPAVVKEIAKLRPDVLWVALGVPREQEFIIRNRRQLRGVGVAKTSGGLFNFLSGTQRRAPDWMQSGGLEWLHRTALEPRRLLWRYASTNLHASYLLLVGTHGIAAGEQPRRAEV